MGLHDATHKLYSCQKCVEDKNQLTVLVQDVKNEIDRIEKDIQRHEMDIQVSDSLIEQPRCYCP